MRPRAVVIDTNVLVSGLLTGNPEAPTARLLDGMARGQFTFLVSPALLAEYRQVLLRSRVRDRHRLDERQVDALLTEIAVNAAVREPVPSGESGPDPGDLHLWDLLFSEAGTLLVTGDQALDLSPPEGASVLTPAGFLEILEAEEPAGGL